MNVSYAAIQMAWELVRVAPFPPEKPFVEASQELQDEGHTTLMFALNNPESLGLYGQGKIPEAYMVVPPMLRDKYAILSRDWKGTIRELVYTSTGKHVKAGDWRHGYQVTGGSAPHKQGSSGKVWYEGGMFFPSVLGMMWK